MSLLKSIPVVSMNYGYIPTDVLSPEKFWILLESLPYGLRCGDVVTLHSGTWKFTRQVYEVIGLRVIFTSAPRHIPQKLDCMVYKPKTIPRVKKVLVSHY